MPIISKTELNEIRAEYKPYFNDIDSDVVSEGENCLVCGSKMIYEGYKGFGEYRALAVCSKPECDVVLDF